MRVAVLFSGGKDSFFSLFWAICNGFKISCLVIVQSKNKDSYMFQTAGVDKSIKIAKKLGFKIEVIDTEGVKEKEVFDLEEGLKKIKRKYNIKALVCGAINSDYQRQRLNLATYSIDIKVLTPLWHINEEKYFEMLLESDFKIFLTKVSSYGLSSEYEGMSLKEVSKKLMELYEENLINLSGEGGEYETVVFDSFLHKR